MRLRLSRRCEHGAKQLEGRGRPAGSLNLSSVKQFARYGSSILGSVGRGCSFDNDMGEE